MGISVTNGCLTGQAEFFRVSTPRTPKKSAAGKAAKKKKLNYNMREISSQIMRAAKSTTASQVLVRAKGKVGVLERCLATGEYEDREVRTALAHAKRMARVAKTKVNNLKEEERQKSCDESDGRVEKQDKIRESRRRMKTKKQELQRRAELQMEGIEQAERQRARYEALLQKRRLNRNSEREEIADADLKYLKGDTGGTEQQPVSYTGVIYQASAQLVSLAAQIQQLEYAEQQQEQLALALDMDTGGISAVEGGFSAETPEAVPAEAVSVDISL